MAGAVVVVASVVVLTVVVGAVATGVVATVSTGATSVGAYGDASSARPRWPYPALWLSLRRTRGAPVS